MRNFAKVLTCLCFCCMSTLSVFAQPYPQLTADVSDWSSGFSTVADIATAFGNARTAENGQSIHAAISTTLTMPSQGVWDGWSPSQKALYLMNAERVARGLLPFGSVSNNINTISQAYATTLLANDQFIHTFGGTTPSSRLNGDAAINGCSESSTWTQGPECLAAFVQSEGTISMPIERSVYGWIYVDLLSGWGHRNTVFALMNNDFGSAADEGFIGIGLATGGPFTIGTLWPVAAVIVFDFVDPCPTSTLSLDQPLPIQLTSFTALSNGANNVKLDWATVSEVNNFGFFVERRRDAESAFTELPNVFIPGHGTTLSPQHYSYVDNSVTLGVWWYRLRQMDLDGSKHYTEAVQTTVVTSVQENAPKEFALQQNYPNPFNPTTEIQFSVAGTGKTLLEVYSVIGQKVATLFDGIAEAGQYYQVRVDGARLSSGVYIYRLQSGAKVELRKMTLLK